MGWGTGLDASHPSHDETVRWMGHPVSCLKGAFVQVGDEGVDADWVRVPGEHDAGCAADEGVELPAAGAQLIENAVRCVEEYGVGVDGRGDGDVGDARDSLGK